MADGPAATCAGHRDETGDVIILVQATWDGPTGRRAPAAERYCVTGKIVRSRAGQVVASTRCSAAGGGAPLQAELQEHAQALADRLIAHVRRGLAAGGAGPAQTASGIETSDVLA